MRVVPDILIRAALGFLCVTSTGAQANAAGTIHKHGGSTNIVRQSGGGGRTSTTVERNRDCQKVVTRQGGNTDVSVQCTGPSRPVDTRRQRPSRPPAHVDCRFGRGVCDEHGDPVPERFEQNIKDRMR